MNPGEHRRMAAVEDQHFWYRGLRDLLLSTVTAAGLPKEPRILDAGCGTGANLDALDEAFRPSYLAGFDVSEEALTLAGRKAPRAALWRADIRDPHLPERHLDLVVSLDVIYIPGADACLEGLGRLVDALAPGGLFVLNLPAYDWLYSEHDEAIHTRERYTAPGVRRLLERVGLRVELLTYRLCALFPLLVARRLPSVVSRRVAAPSRARVPARSALADPPGAGLNATLYRALVAENRLIARGVTMPFGSSVFAVGRRA